MRLPAMGLTLPWQLVAAQEPGPIYFLGSAVEDLLSARDEAQNEKKRAQETTVRTGRLSRMSIRRAGESLCIYLWFCVKSTTVRGDFAVVQYDDSPSSFDTTSYYRTDERKGRFATQLSVPQHFERRGQRR